MTKMTSESNDVTSKVDNVAQQYSDKVALRAAIQLIPYVGGALDTLISGRASQIQLKRVNHFLGELNVRLSVVEGIKADINDEAFMDLMLTTFDKVSRSRSTAKRTRFANIITHQLIEDNYWEDADMAVRLVSDLEDMHIQILEVGIIKSTVFSLSTSAEKDISIPSLNSLLPQYDEIVLRITCTELFSKGLLEDVGASSWNGIGMQKFSPTESARWLYDWIIDKNYPSK